LLVKPEFVYSNDPLHPDWIAGFVTADGHFTLGITKRNTSKFGYRVRPAFAITQNCRDLF